MKSVCAIDFCSRARIPSDKQAHRGAKKECLLWHKSNGPGMLSVRKQRAIWALGNECARCGRESITVLQDQAGSRTDSQLIKSRYWFWIQATLKINFRLDPKKGSWYVMNFPKWNNIFIERGGGGGMKKKPELILFAIHDVIKIIKNCLQRVHPGAGEGRSERGKAARLSDCWCCVTFAR